MVKDIGTEEKILLTAREVFIAEGYDGARMQHIADKAGINKALLHYYFRSKEKLFTAVFEQVFAEIMERIFTFLGKEVSLETLASVFFREHLGFLLREPRMPAFIISEISLHPALLSSVLKRLTGSQIQRFALLIEQEKKAGHVRDDLDYRQLLMNILSLSIFPIVAKPVVKEVMGVTDSEMDDLLKQRMDLLPGMVLASIGYKPSKSEK